MSLVGPGLLVFGEQFITVCDNHGCVVDREFPGARVVSQDERLASAIHRSEHDARLVAPDLWPAATWLLVIGSAVWIYRLSGRWSDLVAAATAPVGTAMLAASLSPDGNFLLEAVAGLAMVVVVLELLAALTLALRQRWLYLACLIVVGRSDRTHTRFDVSRPHLMWGDRCQQPATNPQCQGSHE